MEFPRIDDEHNLIARYAATLLRHENNEGDSHQRSHLNSLSDSNDSFQLSPEYKVHQNLIDELENSNRQIMEEINQLRLAKDSSYSSSNLIFELQMLKQHKGELEGRMTKLHDGRRDLMEQLERLMGLLQARDSNQPSPTHRTKTHKYSSRQDSLTSPRLSSSQSTNSPRRTPQLTPQHSTSSTTSSSYSRTKRQFSDLFSAADSINDALNCLVEQVTHNEGFQQTPDFNSTFVNGESHPQMTSQRFNKQMPGHQRAVDLIEPDLSP